ncbi:Gfo/Idh/MocA family protein [Microbacterium sp. 179-I 3D2 NHS]|uniref:Gfo/Idh/MocA family protein n=1 Tax=Microbacterium sp. 179-I 3D2 NHS TaxID=3235178 RepID=UPI0039A09C62
MNNPTDAIRIGVVGGGLIAQAVHLPNLAANPRTELVALADPSALVGKGLAVRYGIPRTYLDWRAMLDGERLDAVVVCSPHSTHAAIVLAAIDLGVHALVEKPLCIDPADAVVIAERAGAAGVVVQVGYMKRYDPGFESFLDALPPTGDDVHLIDVTTFDPWMSREPFVRWDEFVRGDDIDPALLQGFRAEEAAQVGAAVGADDPDTVRAFSYTFLACLVHDINLVSGVLDRWGVGATAESSHAWADGNAATAALRLDNDAVWRSTWLLLPEQQEFEESARVFFPGSIHELRFPVPYHSEVATEHVVRGSGNRGEVQRTERRFVSDSYVAELNAFVDAVAGAPTNRTPPEQGGRDIALLRDLFLARVASA